jgi:hypothetical protein
MQLIKVNIPSNPKPVKNRIANPTVQHINVKTNKHIIITIELALKKAIRFFYKGMFFKKSKFNNNSPNPFQKTIK